MAFCAFDGSAAGFDVTPVENMFITEYMLRAPGDFVKVYLYGLMLCYHNQERMTLTSMARDLDMTEEDVEHAFRYWARNGLVRQVGDNPVCYAYMNIKQLTLTRAQDPGEKLYNRSFTEEVRRILGDRLTESADYQKIFDWVDVLELSEEVVLMLLQMEVKKSRGRFSFNVADRTARDWAQRGVRTAEDVEKLVIIDEGRKRSLKKLLARLGQRREPSDDEKALYNKWLDEWGFTEDAVQEACRETTKGVPTMAYLDGILMRQHQLGRHDVQELAAGMAREHTERDFAREVYAGLGRAGVTPPQEDLAVIDGWRQMGFTQEMILMAVSEAHAKTTGGSLEDVEAKLLDWKNRGFASADQVRAARVRVKALNEQLRTVYGAMGIEKRVNQPDRDLLSRWLGEMHMPMELVQLAADYARGSASPMMVCNRILVSWQQAGITNEAAAREEHEAHLRTGAGKGVQTARTQDVLLRQTPQERRAAYSAAVVDLDEEES